MPGRPPQVLWQCSRNELSGKTGTVHPTHTTRLDQIDLEAEHL